MEFAIQHNGTYPSVLAAAQWAEREGMAAFAVPDHYVAGGAGNDGPALDAFAMLAGLARDTERIELINLVAPITFRHPAVIYKSSVTISEMSDGRFKLGMGTGWLEDEHRLFGLPFPERTERFDMLEEALGYVRAASAGESFAGRHYQLEAFDHQPRPPLPIVVGGMGPHRTPRLAGAYADELNAYPAPPDEYAAKVERAREAARQVGRDPVALLVSTSGVFLGADTQEGYESKLADFANTMGGDVTQLRKAFELRQSPVGTWDVIVSRMRALIEVGVTRIYIQSFGEFDPDNVAQVIERVGD